MVVADGCPDSHEGALRPLFGSTRGELRFDLVRDDAIGSESPFVQLHSGRFSQILLASIDLGVEAVSTFALKLQRHDYLAEPDSTLTNPEVEAMWAREAEDLRLASSPHVVALAPYPRPHLQSKPTFFCRKQSAFFHPPCPKTGRALTVCKDDDLLRAKGLAGWSTSLVRYLHCGTVDADAPFYRMPGAVKELARDGARVRIGMQLVRDWRDLVHRTGAATEAWFPCLGCEHKAACYPQDVAAGAAIPAEAQLFALSYYDFRALPLEVLDLTWDEFCDFAGGRSWDEVTASLGHLGSGRRRVLRHLDEAMRQSRHYLFRDDAPRFALEALRLKLTGLLEVCDGLRAIHTKCERPHFAVAPSNIMVRFLPGGQGTPVRWSFRTCLIDLGSAVPLQTVGATGEGMPRLLEQGSELRRTPFHAPHLDRNQDRVTDRFVVVVKKREQVDNRVRLVLDANGTVNLRDYRPGDVAQLLPSGASAPWWTHVAELTDKRATLVVELERDPESGGEVSPRLAPPFQFEAGLTFFKNYGTSCDLFGLGMLMFRTLLVNDAQDMETVREAVDGCLRRIEDAVPKGRKADADPDEVRRQVLRQVQQLKRKFAPTSVLWHGADRNRPDAGLDAGLWSDLLELAFRLATSIPGYSFADSHAETHPNNLAALMTAVMERLVALQRRTFARLFADEECDAAILAASSAMLESVHAAVRAEAKKPQPRPAAAAAPRPAPAIGFELEITDASDQVTRRAFKQEYVTIGRQKDNALVLNDRRVSRQHAVIEKQGGSYTIRDVGSTEGTVACGKPVSEIATLLDSDVVEIGPFKLRFLWQGGETGGGDAADQDMTMVFSGQNRTGGGGRTSGLLGDLRGAFATQVDAGVEDRRRAIQELLERHRAEAQNRSILSAFAAELEDIVEQLSTGARTGSGGKPRTGSVEVAHHALVGLEGAVRSLHGNDAIEFGSVAEVATFCELWRHHTETVLEWMRTASTEGLAYLGSIELAPKQLKRSAPWIDGTASRAEVARTLLPLRDSGSAASASDGLLKDLKLMQVGVLSGIESVVRVLKESLDPKEIEKGAKGGLFGARPWDAYVQKYDELMKKADGDMDRLRRLRDAILAIFLEHQRQPKREEPK